MDFFSLCHRTANVLSDLLQRPSTTLAWRCQEAHTLLAELVAEGNIDLAGDHLEDRFFSSFASTLVRGVDGAVDDEQSLLTLLLEFCGAMGSGPESMDGLLRSIEGGTEQNLAPRPEYRPSATTRPGIPVTILIVEDDRTFAQHLARALADFFSNDDRFAVSVATHVPLRDADGRVNENQLQFLQRLRRRLELLSDEEDPPLTYLQAAIVDYALTSLPIGDGATSSLTGVEIAKTIRNLHPGTFITFLSGENVLSIVDRTGTDFGPTYWKHDDNSLAELSRAVRRNLQQKYETPFWNALRDFTTRPLSTFHAMPLARAKSLPGSSVLTDFRNFFGDNYFYAETSATGAPLDSLLHPTGSIRRAAIKAAATFGAAETYFVTNGTSTANKIVLQALVRRGDPVLLDRSCHVSHHYGLALLGARPYYLEPYQLTQYGIAGGIPVDHIESALQEHMERHSKGLEQHLLPRLLILTNRTFDGILTRPTRIFERVRALLRSRGCEERLGEMVFFFDEAWFAYGRFHPTFLPFSALEAAEDLRRDDAFYADHLRLYVTQSTHKTLSAFRQASMIHVSDPFFHRGIASERFDLAYRSHTTTSPHSGIIASLDVSSRQMNLEGCALVNRALYWSERFRTDAAEPGAAPWRQRFRVLTEEEMVPAEIRSECDAAANDRDQWAFHLDPTCITVHFREGWHGAELKRRLLADHDVQINKHSENTILMMVTLGSTFSDLVAMKRALMKATEELEESARAGLGTWRESSVGYELPRFSGFWEGEVDGDRPGERHDIGFFSENLAGWDTAWVDLDSARGQVSVNYVAPYPPGYPILVPGQVVDGKTIEYLQSLHSREIHGLRSRGAATLLEVYKLT